MTELNEDRCQCDCYGCICNSEIVGILRQRLLELEPDVPCAAFVDDHLHNLIARYLHWKKFNYHGGGPAEAVAILDQGKLARQAIASSPCQCAGDWFCYRCQLEEKNTPPAQKES